MRIVWDEPKRLATLKGRGLDFADVMPEFFDTASITPAKKGRFIAVGAISGRTLAVVFARLGSEGVSIVSMRQASRKERTP